jgi:hypothetical protein
MRGYFCPTDERLLIYGCLSICHQDCGLLSQQVACLLQLACQARPAHSDFFVHHVCPLLLALRRWQIGRFSRSATALPVVIPKHWRIPMRNINRTIAFAFTILISGSLAFAQAAPAGATDPSKPIAQFTQRFQNNLMALAKAMPADKYSFAPSSDIFKAGSPAKFDGVRTFAQQLTHVAAYTFQSFAPYGIKPDSSIDVSGLNAVTSKDEVIKAIQASFDYQNKVIASLTAENAFTPQGQRGNSLMSTIVSVLNDDGDHYGQLVEYGRMNGIIPPASERPERPATPPAPQK